MTWLPAIAVLVLGLGGGLFAAYRLRRGVRHDGRRHDLELRIADLEARRDELYRRIQDTTDERERERLETAAARTLRDLDRCREDLGGRRPPKAARGEAAPAPAAAPAAPSARPFLVGLLYGGGLVALVGILLYWALRDAQPRPEEAPPPAPAAGVDDPHAGEVPPEVAARLRSLDEHILANPEDIEARKEMAYLLLGVGRFFDAFGQAGQILRRSAEDPDGLYLQGVIRLTMGNRAEGNDLLARALASDPEHVDALLASGIVRLEEGDSAAAIALWERALEAAGGSQPTVERLLELAREGRTAEEILGTPAGGAAPAPAAAASVVAEGGETEQADEDLYRVVVGLGPGIRPGAGAVLFVSLRETDSGPPVAVKRISGPVFPLELTLGQRDSMMGTALPAAGTLTVRLDGDGNASTRGPEDFDASERAEVGKLVSVVLQP